MCFERRRVTDLVWLANDLLDTPLLDQFRVKTKKLSTKLKVGTTTNVSTQIIFRHLMFNNPSVHRDKYVVATLLLRTIC